MADEKPRPAVPRARTWRPGSAVAATGQAGASRRGKKAFVVLAVILALAGVLLGLLFLISPFKKPVFLSLPITEYNDPRYPSNAFAQQDGEALLGRFPAAGSELAFDSQQENVLKVQLAGLKDRKSGVLVLHVSSLAVRREGKVYLLPANADPSRPEIGLPLDELLQAVSACPAPNKLLMLDVMKPLADARLGVPYNPVVEEVERAVQGMSGSPFWVLCACSPGQVSLVSEDVHRSVFGYYLERGLRGRAAGFAPTSKKKDRVRVRDLAAYVATRVDRWAWDNRATRQTPLLLGGGDDFELALVEKNPLTPAAEASDDYPTQLQKGWEQRDAWMLDGGLRAAPGVLRDLDVTLLWAEQRWRGGFDFKRVYENRLTHLERFQQQVSQARPREPPRSRSLALGMTAAKQEQPDEALLEELKELASLADKIPSDKDRASAQKAALDEKKTPFLKKMVGKPLLLAEAVYQVAFLDPTPNKVRFLSELLGPSVPLFGETLQLRNLEELDAKKWPPSPKLIKQMLQLAREREKATSCDPALLPWIAPRLCAAAAKLHDAERLLDRADAASWDQAEARLGEAERKIASCLAALDLLQEARGLVDQALEVLPGVVPYLTGRPKLSAGDERAWHEAARSCRALHELLAPNAESLKACEERADDPFDLHQDALRQHNETLRERLRVLRLAFDAPDLNNLLTQSEKSDATVETLLEIYARLTTPLINGKLRVALWKAARSLARRLHDRTDSAEDDRDHPPAPLPVYGVGERKLLEAQERERAAARVRLSLGLLRLGGLDPTNLGVDEAQLAQKPDAVDWETVGKKLYDVWSRQVPDRFQELVQKEALAAADCLNRVAPPFDLPPSARSRENEADLTAETRRRQERRSWSWLGKHYYSEEAKQYPDETAAAAFYRRAAAEFLEREH